MPHLRKLPNVDEFGWDPGKNLQILPVNHRTTFYLMAGADLTVYTEDYTVAHAEDQSGKLTKSETQSKSLTEWEKTVSMRKIIVKGESVGSTTLFAKLGGTDIHMIAPVTIEVVQNPEYRQAKDSANFTGTLKKELDQLSLRDAVIRVAEDQMNSKLGKTSHGGQGKYTDPKYDWCGAFAWWCWSTACALKGETCPFGNNIDVLLSPQKAIHWVMDNPGKAELLRYEGMDPMTGKGKYAFQDIDGSHKVERADIVLYREDANWKHVALVDTPPTTGPFVSLDGNQGFPSIKRVDRDASKKLANKSYAYVFVHLL